MNVELNIFLFMVFDYEVLLYMSVVKKIIIYVCIYFCMIKKEYENLVIYL